MNKLAYWVRALRRGRIRRIRAIGSWLLGGLLEDPTVYEDLSALLRGANRSMLLKGLIRSTVEEGARQKP